MTTNDGDSRLIDPLVRRWTAIGTALAVGAFWMLGTLGRPWRLWADPSVLTSNFFDIQAHSLLNGRLSVPAGSLLIEEFVTPHGSYMYFGILPALLRVPVHLVVGGLDGRLTLTSCLLAAAVVCVGTARLARRAQRQFGLAAGDAAVSPRWYVVIAAAPVLFSPFLFLASRSQVYNEAIAWGVAGAVWGIDAVLQWWYLRQRRFAVVAALVAIVAISARPSVGLVPTLMLVVFALVLAWRRCWTQAALSGVMGAAAIMAYSTVNYARFRQLWGAPGELQKSFEVLAEQQAAVALTGGSLFDVRFMPTTISTYFSPSLHSIRLTRLFPFVAPGAAPSARSYAPMQLTPSGSIPIAAPVLAALAIVGVVWVVRRGDTAWRVAAGTAFVAAFSTLGFWAVWHRYLVDFVPLIVVLAVPGCWVVVRAARGWPRWGRAALGVAAVTMLALGAAGQVGLSLWTRFFSYGVNPQEFVAVTQFRYALDDALFGGAPPDVVRVPAWQRSDRLPRAAFGHLLIAGDCDALYFGAFGWEEVERRSGGDRRVVVSATRAELNSVRSQPRIVVDGDGWRLWTRPTNDAAVAELVYSGPGGVETVGTVEVGAGGVVLDVVADPFLSVVDVSQDRRSVLTIHHAVAGGMTASPGWAVWYGTAPICDELLARMP